MGHVVQMLGFLTFVRYYLSCSLIIVCLLTSVYYKIKRRLILDLVLIIDIVSIIKMGEDELYCLLHEEA